MLTTQKKIEQQRIQLSILAWKAFYTRLLEIIDKKDKFKLQNKLKAKYQKKQRLKQKKHKSRIAQHSFFAHKNQAIKAQAEILSYNESRPFGWRKP